MAFTWKTKKTHDHSGCARILICLAVWMLALSGRVTAQSEANINIMRMEPSGSHRVDSRSILRKEAADPSGVKPRMRPGRRLVPVLDLKQRKLIRMDTLPEPARMRPENRLSAESTARTWTTIMTEDFEGPWPSAGWARGGDMHSSGVEITWAPWAYHPASGLKSCFAQGTVVDPSSQHTIKAPWGEFHMSAMWYGPINLEGVTDARITFKLSYQLGDGDFIDWTAFTTADTSGEMYMTGYPESYPSNWPDYETFTYNFNSQPYHGSLCGLRDVYFIIIYLADDYQDYNKAAFVDDVRLQTSTDPLPRMSIDAGEWTVPSVGGTSETVHVTSSDEAFSYTVSDDDFWLTLSESGGTTPGGFTMRTAANETGLTRKAKVTVTADPHTAVTGSPATLKVTQISPSDSGWTTLMTEDFEGEWPSEGWTLDSNTLDEDGTPITWDPVTFYGAWGSRSAHPHESINPMIDATVTAAAGTTIESSMRYGPFSLPEDMQARFRFRLTYQLGAGDKIQWGVSAGDPDTTTRVMMGYSGMSNFALWRVLTFDLTEVPYYGSLAGRTDVYIHFIYVADDVQDRNEGAYVDDVYLQARPFKARLSLDTAEWAAPPAGGTSGAIHVASTGEAFQYTAQANVRWLRVSYPWWGMTPGVISLSASANRTDSARTAEVRVWATNPEGIAGSPATITVTQGPIPPPRISLSDSTWSAPPAGGVSDSIRVLSSGDAVLYTVSAGADWLTLSDFDGSTPGGFTMTAAANVADTARAAVVTVTAVSPAGTTGSPATITVTQGPIPPPRMFLSDSTWSAPSLGGTSDTLRVSSSGGTVLYAISDDADWLTLSGFNGTTPGGFIMTAAANDADSSRTAVVTVRAVIPADTDGSPARVTVTQPKVAVPASIGLVAPSAVMPGDEFQADIHIGDPIGVTDLFLLRFDLTFSNTAYVDYVSAEPGPFLGTDSEILPVSDDAAGKVSVTLIRNSESGGVSGTGVAVRVRFRALPDAPENTRVDFALSGIAAEDPEGNPVPFEATGNSSTVMTHVEEGGDAASHPIPEAFELSRNFPNPFNPVTEIRFGLPHAGDVELKVFDGSGRVVAVLFEGFRQAGYHSVTFNAAKLPSGSYTCRLQAGGRVLTRKMMLVK